MRNFHNTFNTLKRPFTSVFSICMTVPLTENYFAKPSIPLNESFQNNLQLLRSMMKHAISENSQRDINYFSP